MRKYFNTVEDRVTGKPVSGAIISVLTAPTTLGGVPVNIYSDDGITLILDELATDQTGYFEFYVADGSYTLEFAYSGETIRVITDVDIGFIPPASNEQASVLEWGADPAGIIPSTAAFISARDAAGEGGSVLVPFGDYLLEDEVALLDGQTWFFDGARLFHNDNTKKILRIDNKSDVSILGSLTLEGLLAGPVNTGECGLHITGGERLRIEGVKARLFQGKGIWLDGTSAGSGGRGDRGQFTDCSAHECFSGLQIDAGAGAEYNTWSNFTASGNITGITVGAGNNTFVGGNCVDNTKGIHLVAGSNHGHGMFIGMNINHNISENLHAENVLNGHSFIGCHFYGNGGGTGIIWLDGAKGVHIGSGIIDCPIYNDLDTGSGANFITDNYFPGDYGVSLLSNNGGLKNLYLSGNFGPTGPSALNDPAPVYLRAARNGSSQALADASDVQLIYNVDAIDNREAHDNTTGDFVCPVDGVYRVQPGGVLTGTALTGGFVAVNLNGATVDYIPITPSQLTTAGDIALLSGFVDVEANAGQTIACVARARGTSPVLATGSQYTITLLG